MTGTDGSDVRLRKIADLTRRRDAMLANAPKHVFFGRLIIPFILFPSLLGLVKRLCGGNPTAVHMLVPLVIFGVAGLTFYKLWRPKYNPRDLWAASDRVGYEGESPRDIQRRIDALQAELTKPDQ